MRFAELSAAFALMAAIGCKAVAPASVEPRQEAQSSPMKAEAVLDAECAGLEAYPWPRSYEQIVADAPPGSRKNTGMLEARIVIGPDGKISHLRFLRLSTSDSVNREVIARIRGWHYKPAVVDRKAVSVCSILSVNVDFTR
ncbi:MAG TPA: energy transducer TonB [Bryobacteraceae bacterium]|nr:energy transducer TonB [Bryobacteraceae bacterium]